MDKPKLLWMGDSPIKSKENLEPPSGFGRVSHEIIGRLSEFYDITVYALNFECDDTVTTCFCTIIPSYDHTNKDPYGYVPLTEKVDINGFDKIVLFNDLWIINYYLHFSPALLEKPLYFYFPVDSEGYSEELICNLSKAKKVATYTNFGQRVLQSAGWTGETAIIPHGYSNWIYPIDKSQSRDFIFKDILPNNAFVVFSANRNTERKRLDILVKAFVLFAKLVELEREYERPVYLYLHCGLKDAGFWVQEIFTRECQKLGMKLNGRLLMPSVGSSTDDKPKPSYFHPHIPDELLNIFYNAVDVNVNVSTGEGWGLTSTESALVGCPQVYTDFAALGDIFSEESGYPIPPKLILTDHHLNLERAYLGPSTVAERLLDVYRDSIYNPDVIRRKTSNARNLVSPLTWDYIANIFTDFLRDDDGNL